jgi:hypothetical protein
LVASIVQYVHVKVCSTPSPLVTPILEGLSFYGTKISGAKILKYTVAGQYFEVKLSLNVIGIFRDKVGELGCPESNPGCPE